MLKLVIANKVYSSWSLRPWMVMRAFAIPFEEIVIPLREADSNARLAAYSPSGKVPVLLDGDVKIWESLAIIEYLSERYPGKAIWPAASGARALARSISNEMHGGFMPLRQGCPMNIGATFKTPVITPEMRSNIGRIENIWAEMRAAFSGEGPYLFGAFSAADAMYAPVATRLQSYQIPVAESTRNYIETVLSHPTYLEWRKSALEEPWSIAGYGAGHTAVETYR